MAGLQDTLAALAAAGADALQPPGPDAKELRETASFGSNPGELRMLSYRPRSSLRGRPLMVVLHGCTQSASGYAAGAGWLALAKACGFALLCPEQRRGNNLNLCFNWFEPADARRGRGETASVKAMIDALVADADLDPQRVFITGLSAGAALAGALLAAYPERFAGGALIAGLPFGVANDLSGALACMRGQNLGGAVTKGKALATRRPGPLPKIAVWQGAEDHTVRPAAGDAVAAQWIAAHRLDPDAALADAPAPGWTRRRWGRSPDGPLVELNVIAGMGHGTPVAPAQGPEGGAAGPFLLDVGVPSSLEIARGFGLAPTAGRREGAQAAPAPAPRRRSAVPPQTAVGDVGAVITSALRRAGLLK